MTVLVSISLLSILAIFLHVFPHCFTTNVMEFLVLSPNAFLMISTACVWVTSVMLWPSIDKIRMPF